VQRGERGREPGSRPIAVGEETVRLMAAVDLWNSPDIVPAIKCSDLALSVEWFERVFGFRERREARLTWPGGGMTWIEAGNGLFNISAPRGDAATSGVVMKVYVDGVDAHFSRVQGEGATIVSAPQDGFWAGESIAFWISKGICGRCPSEAGTCPRNGGHCLPA
jgi:uncharacterized glyoxalase superfamily protein PhnB